MTITRTDEPYNISLHYTLEQPLVRGRGNIWPLCGYIEGDLKKIDKVEIQINNQRTEIAEVFEVKTPIDNIDFFRTTLLPNKYHFYHLISSNDYPGNRLEIDIVITYGSKVQKTNVGDLVIIDEINSSPPPLKPSKVAICMTTYNPKLNLFKRQIDSIIKQTEESWQLIIQDDHSDEDIFHGIQLTVQDEDRIHLYRNDRNLGFYYNFENCLMKAHSQFEFIALADQDDEWHFNKLERLIDEIDSNLLIYNDMHIKSADGSIIWPSFWKYRSNHYKSISAFFLSNTVTGSASIFRSSLLNKILPFPPKIGNSFHDHWIGLAASMSDGIKYLDEALQSYIQHDNNVTGYGRFKEVKLGESTLSLLSLQRMKASVLIDSGSDKNIQFVKNNLKVYFDAYVRRKIQYKILLQRIPGSNRKTLDRVFLSSKKDIQQLLSLHWKIYKKEWKTNNAELSYINAKEVMKGIRVKFKK